MKLSVVAFVLGAMHQVQAAPGDGGRLNTFAKPKVTVHIGDEIKDIKNWDDAFHFCWHEQEYRMLASQWELCCWFWHPDPTQRRPLGGQKPDDQWVPARSKDKNEWVQMGTSNEAEVCETYRSAHGIPYPHDLIAVTAEPWESPCEKPTDCTGGKCPMKCTEKEAFYPDPTDCKAYCYCSGKDDLSSFWEEVEGDDLIWDPFCADSDPIDYGNKPLGGMTGGCPNHPHYVDDNSYCEPARLRELVEKQRRMKEQSSLRGIQRILAQEVDWSPDWGFDQTKQSFEANEVACVAWPTAPELPQNCASLWGDPHFTTYDGLNYDCMGTGEFIATKSLDSPLELQVGIEKFDDAMQATVTRKAVLKTGNPNEPKVEFRFGGYQDCQLLVFIDDEQKDVDGGWCEHGSLATGTEKAAFFASWDDRYIYFPESKISFHVRKKNSKTMGCYMDVKVCLPDEVIENQKIVGLFGTPDGKDSNDFNGPQGQDLQHNGKTEWGDAYAYCTANWCIRDPDTNCLFKDDGSRMDPVTCDEPYDDTLEEMVNNAPDELKAVCGSNPACLIEGLGGDVADAVDSVRTLEENGVEVVPEDKTHSAEEQDEVFETTTTKPAPAPTESTPVDQEPAPQPGPAPAPAEKGGSAFGDPHFKTWNEANKFDFHGGCDLVLLDNPSFGNGIGMTIHIRTEIFTWWSYIKTAAIRIGEDILEVQGGEQQKYWVNGVEGDVTLKDFAFSKLNLKVGLKHATGRQLKLRLELLNADAIGFEVFKDFVRVNVKETDPKWNKFASSVGLMGQHPSGATIGRDGITAFTDMNAFGMEWQVKEDEPKLFHAIEGPQHPAQCTMPTEVSAEDKRRRLGEWAISEEDAEIACAHVPLKDRDACVFDVLATNDKDMAGSY